MAGLSDEITQIEVSEARYGELKSQVKYSEKDVATVRELFFGDHEHWPCPRCPRGEARKAKVVRRARLRPDAEGYPREEGFEDEAKRTFKFLKVLGDPFGSAAEHLAFRALGIPTEDGRAAALVYECQQHGEFYVPLDEEDEPMVGRTWLPRDGRLEISRLRFAVCPGLVELVDTNGGTLRVEACGRVLEWSGECERCGTGDCSWTCPLHGTTKLHADGTEEDFPYLLVRRLASS